MIQSSEVPGAVRELADGLAQPQPMRRGSVSERYVKCSKPGCACATNPRARHGPYFSLTRAVGGQTHSRFLSSEEAALVREQIARGQQFRQRVETYWTACERWADAQLEKPEAPEEPEVKKNRARRGSGPRLGR